MNDPARPKIVIVGCGNVAWHLAKHLVSLNKYTISVYNRSANPLLTDFKTILKCTIQTGLERVIQDAEIYFICVADEFIEEVAKKVDSRNPNALLLHNSGSAKIKVLGDRIHGTGVFYPLQSFSRKDRINWAEIPIIIEGKNKEVEKNLVLFAKNFSKTVLPLAYKERLKLHLAAVLVNNFTNSLYVAAENLLSGSEKKTNLKLLLPLINKTAEKLNTLTALEAQTGPARREDKVTMKKHLRLLKEKKDLKRIYKQVSSLIQKQQANNYNEL